MRPGAVQIHLAAGPKPVFDAELITAVEHSEV